MNNKRRARDPNTPPLELFKLARYEPEAALENPMLPFLTLEDPGILGRADGYGLQRLLALEGAPEEWLWLCKDDNRYGIQSAIARNPACPPGLLRTLYENNKSGVRATIFRNPDAPTWMKVIRVDERWGRSSVRRNASLPPVIRDGLSELWDDPETLAMQPGLRRAEVRRLLRSSNSRVAPALAGNPAAPAWALEQLAMSPQAVTRAAAAANPSLPPRALALLERDTSQDVQRALARRRR